MAPSNFDTLFNHIDKLESFHFNADPIMRTEITNMLISTFNKTPDAVLHIHTVRGPPQKYQPTFTFHTNVSLIMLSIVYTSMTLAFPTTPINLIGKSSFKDQIHALHTENITLLSQKHI